MVSKRDGKLVLWPIYFDKDAPRAWRRVPLDLAIAEPTAEEVAKAAQTIRLKPILEKGVPHPSRWYARSGRVLVDVRGAKSVLLRQIGEELKIARAKAPAPPAKAANAPRRKA
jgi:signal recognition particle subunit SRP19